MLLQDLYKPDVDHIVTAASCTTNCLAPVVKVRPAAAAAGPPNRNHLPASA
jgi:glyceraldehyde-3-phosphate dehydrogenase/erythrose-4-phosphate dehydrogenase